MFYNILKLSLIILTIGYVVAQEANESKDGQIESERMDGVNTTDISDSKELLEASKAVELIVEETKEAPANEGPKNDKIPEKELKAWVKNLNCNEAIMGPLKCSVVKKISSKYYGNPQRDPTMIKVGLKYLYKNLQASGQVDPELERLVGKYFKTANYLNGVNKA